MNEEIHNFARNLFDQTFDGPPRAYFELRGKRGVYSVWAMYTTDLARGHELIELLKKLLQDLRDRGGVSIFWRRDTEYRAEKWNTTDDPDSPTYDVICVSARFVVWDVDCNEVPWPEGVEQPDGSPMRLLP